MLPGYAGHAVLQVNPAALAGLRSDVDGRVANRVSRVLIKDVVCVVKRIFLSCSIFQEREDETFLSGHIGYIRFE